MESFTDALCPDSLALIGVYGSVITGDEYEKSEKVDGIRRKAADKDDVYSSFMNLLSLQWMFYEIAECIAVDGFEVMDKFSPKSLEENVGVFDQALNKYLAEYGKVGICSKHFESMTEFIESYNKEIILAAMLVGAGLGQSRFIRNG